MSLKIDPRPRLDSMNAGEEIAYTIDLTSELGDNTVDTYTYKIYDEDNVDVTNDFSGDSSLADGIITFGVVGYDVGQYRLTFWVTCIEMLPDGITPYEFTFDMFVSII